MFFFEISVPKTSPKIYFGPILDPILEPCWNLLGCQSQFRVYIEVYRNLRKTIEHVIFDNTTNTAKYNTRQHIITCQNDPSQDNTLQPSMDNTTQPSPQMTTQQIDSTYTASKSTQHAHNMPHRSITQQNSSIHHNTSHHKA